MESRGKFDAVRMLLRLSDRSHRVLTAVSVMCHDKSKTICSETAVTFKAITTEEAEDYWESGEPRGRRVPMQYKALELSSFIQLRVTAGLWAFRV